jgi:polysaccharide biosynthesis protein PslH
MKILLLCNKSPWPPLEGGPIAMNAMVNGLIKAGHQVKVLAINSNKYNVSIDSIPEDYRLKTAINAVYIDLSVKPLHAFLNLFTGRSYHVERFISEDFRRELTKILKEEKFDIIQFETLFTSPYLPLIRQLSDARVILRAHNIEHLIWQRIAEGCTNPFKKLYLFYLASTLKRYEIKTLKLVDGVAAITEKDAEFFRSVAPETPVTSIPFGISSETTGRSSISKPKPGLPTLFHIGSMNWIPNQDGIRWFLTKVWPEVSTRFPELKFHIAGREMPGWIKELNSNGVVIDGEVPDAMSYIKSHSVMIVPLFSGSGIRIKIIEGMLAEKAIVTTTIGAEGIDGKDGVHFLIANDVAGFMNAIEKCLKIPGLIEELGQNALKLVKQNHNNDNLMQKISDFYFQLG